MDMKEYKKNYDKAFGKSKQPIQLQARYCPKCNSRNIRYLSGQKHEFYCDDCYNVWDSESEHKEKKE